ncbi:hypothetical protein AGMMS4957_09500 [Bacteroidia bacterium]|nr:hypothetical protein AGMMS4957_09500 [Bacteroidia bacterium]
MNIKKTMIFAAIAASLFATASLHAQTNFEQWKQQRQKEFSDYSARQKANLALADSAWQSWKTSRGAPQMPAPKETESVVVPTVVPKVEPTIVPAVEPKPVVNTTPVQNLAPDSEAPRKNLAEFEVDSWKDLPVGKYYHPTEDYFKDISYNADGNKVSDTYSKNGGGHSITTSGGRSEFEGWDTGNFIYFSDREWDEYAARWYNTYNTDKEFKKLVDLCKDIANNSTYDWDYWYEGLPHDINRGFICADYADFTQKTLSEQGYDVKIATSSRANHAWNEVVLADGRKVYVDVTWFDKDYDGTKHVKQTYDIKWIALDQDKAIFDYGFSGKVKKHYAFGDVQYRDKGW